MTRGKHKVIHASGKPDFWRLALGLALLASIPQLGGAALPVLADSDHQPTLVVSRIQYVGDTNPARRGETFPLIFNDPNVTGIQGKIFLDMFRPDPGSHRLGSLAPTDLTNGAVTTSFSSKSEGSFHLSVDGHSLTYMGYIGPAGRRGRLQLRDNRRHSDDQYRAYLRPRGCLDRGNRSRVLCPRNQCLQR
jgi:hypothetical protein